MRIVIPDDYQDCLHTLDCYAAFAGHEVVRYREPARDLAQFAEMLRDADAVVAVRERSEFPRALLEQLPRLKLISQVGRSAHTIDLVACNELGITVCAGTQASPVAPAEMTWALILSTRRNVVLEAERMRRGEWPATLSHRLSGSTLGIFGLGTIGQLVARVGPAFGMRVLVWGREGSRAIAERIVQISAPALKACCAAFCKSVGVQPNGLGAFVTSWVKKISQARARTARSINALARASASTPNMPLARSCVASALKVLRPGWIPRPVS
jgi:D-3-phosphoglycerate dehydrogenase